MENLKLDELNLIRVWYECMYSYTARSTPEDLALIEKIKQMIDDKEFEEKAKPLNF